MCCGAAAQIVKSHAPCVAGGVSSGDQTKIGTGRKPIGASAYEHPNHRYDPDVCLLRNRVHLLVLAQHRGEPPSHAPKGAGGISGTERSGGGQAALGSRPADERLGSPRRKQEVDRASAASRMPNIAMRLSIIFRLRESQCKAA